MLAKQVEGLLFFADCRFISFHSSIKSTSISTSDLVKGWARDGAVVRVPASDQCGPGSNPSVYAICVLSLLLVLSFALRGFSPGTPVFPSSQKQHSKINCNLTRNQVDRTTLWMCYRQIIHQKTHWHTTKVTVTTPDQFVSPSKFRP